ncbi:MAG: hypothetical protein COZ46_00900 [Verrucomicrobia bacterium CG_4_10_14_3_um_filter_43_23]|nr:MAG: hypothetical protein COX01_07450 [Verrucomicrobia bacterium CG22_combo_CG10-13_8_21_14_all_43_17]PIX59038.1 MAG: hypothetical protein COZ46_00900 [Verrucomicrobia bacterium CG_4_10_14_3_um_filter_43_23]PIY61614.1 MAG: hypothetical protein COY94_04465 [Verrucomicrobia bacterium CG_4_10_14_0_8_um_filter_43_34]PJA44523.1 MAG: hypothetical protein CO175_02485 [Verrucomicrobia bacterium CG_4_9_14_3_um_filter_43_20]
MTYVVMVFIKVFGMDIQTAKEHMLEVHQHGSSVLYRGPKEQAELYVQLLHQWQLNAFLEQDA